MLDVGDDADYSVAKNTSFQNFLKLEADYLRHVRQGEIQVDPSVGIDVVIRWQITKRNTLKQGFLSFFGLKIVSNQLNLTETQQKLHHEYRINKLISEGF